MILYILADENGDKKYLEMWLTKEFVTSKGLINEHDFGSESTKFLKLKRSKGLFIILWKVSIFSS